VQQPYHGFDIEMAVMDDQQAKTAKVLTGKSSCTFKSLHSKFSKEHSQQSKWGGSLSQQPKFKSDSSERSEMEAKFSMDASSKVDVSNSSK
jgi:hypothetical protein